MWAYTKRVICVACTFVVMAGAAGHRSTFPAAAGDGKRATGSIGALEVWPRQEAVCVSVYRRGWHEDYLVALETGRVLWSRRQQRGRDFLAYFGPVSPDGTRVVVRQGRRSELRGTSIEAVGVAETETPGRVRRIWQAPAGSRVLEVKATWARNSEAVFVQDIEVGPSLRNDKPFTAQVESVRLPDLTVQLKKTLTAVRLRHEAKIKAFWCPPATPAYCMLALEEITVPQYNPVLRIPLAGTRAFRRVARFQGRLHQVVPSPNDRRIALSSTEDTPTGVHTTLRILTGHDLKPAWELPLPLKVGSSFAWVCWSPDGERLVGFGGRGLYLIDVEKKRVGPLGRVPQMVGRATWAPDGKAVLFSTTDRLMVIDVHTQEVRTVWSVPESYPVAE